MLTLAYDNDKIHRLPKLKKPKDGKPRQGFLEPAQFASASRHLPPDLQVAAAVGYVVGWRLQEVLTLERRQLDLGDGVLRLDPEHDKEDDGRVVYLTPELRTLLSAHVARVDALQKRLGRIIPFLFPHMQGTKRAGQCRQDYRKAWATACRKAGVPGMLRHDMRRSAVRNMVTRDGRPRAGGDADYGAQDPSRVRHLPHRLPWRSPGGGPEDGGRGSRGL